MPAACRLGDLVQIGAITGPGAPKVMINSIVSSVVGDSVSAHGEAPHTAPTIATGSAVVFMQNKPATVQGISTATCAHSASTGSPNVFIGK